MNLISGHFIIVLFQLRGRKKRGGCTLGAMKQSQQGKEAGRISQLVFARSHRGVGGRGRRRRQGVCPKRGPRGRRSKGRSIDYPSVERSGTGYDTLYLCWRNRRELIIAGSLRSRVALKWRRLSGCQGANRAVAKNSMNMLKNQFKLFRSAIRPIRLFKPWLPLLGAPQHLRKRPPRRPNWRLESWRVLRACSGQYFAPSL